MCILSYKNQLFLESLFHLSLLYWKTVTVTFDFLSVLELLFSRTHFLSLLPDHTFIVKDLKHRKLFYPASRHAIQCTQGSSKSYLYEKQNMKVKTKFSIKCLRLMGNFKCKKKLPYVPEAKFLQLSRTAKTTIISVILVAGGQKKEELSILQTELWYSRNLFNKMSPTPLHHISLIMLIVLLRRWKEFSNFADKIMSE